MAHPINQLIELLSKMPGIGPRQARRIAQFLLRAPVAYRKKVIEGIERIAERVSQCALCYRFDEVDAGAHCSLCASAERDESLLAVVEKDVDVESIEQAGIYKGRYFVLGGLIPLARQRKGASSPRVDLLKSRMNKDKKIQEVVLAFAITPEGDYTAREIIHTLRETFPHTAVSMLGRGLSLGAEIEYADQETLRNAFTGRH